ncbi:MAG: hypothetical protein IPN79_04695 [Saprospiraceae bacterium]|nr:hypothetical protein [Saprospiraceae bacterium]
MRILIFILVFYIQNGLLCQTDINNYKLVFNFSPTYGYHSNNPVQFPLGYTDASITPINQDYKIGYDISLNFIRQIDNRFRIGVTTYTSRFGFIESGHELYYWSNQIHNYEIERQFILFGIGILSGYTLLKKNLSKIVVSSGLSYETFIKKEGVYLWSESENNRKYSFNGSIEFMHKLTNSVDILIGLNTRTGLNNYFSTIDYKPLRFGCHFGFEYSLNRKIR